MYINLLAIGFRLLLFILSSIFLLIPQNLTCITSISYRLHLYFMYLPIDFFFIKIINL